MPWTTRILVVANETACAPELLEALQARNNTDHAEFTLVMPVGTRREDSRARLEAALKRMRTEGLRVDGCLGSIDPLVAVTEVFDPARFDEIVVSTLPAELSRWLACSLPRRVERLTGMPVVHVEASRHYCELLDEQPVAERGANAHLSHAYTASR